MNKKEKEIKKVEKREHSTLPPEINKKKVKKEKVKKSPRSQRGVLGMIDVNQEQTQTMDTNPYFSFSRRSDRKIEVEEREVKEDPRRGLFKYFTFPSKRARKKIMKMKVMKGNRKYPEGVLGLIDVSKDFNRTAAKDQDPIQNKKNGTAPNGEVKPFAITKNETHTPKGNQALPTGKKESDSSKEIKASAKKDESARDKKNTSPRDKKNNSIPAEGNKDPFAKKNEENRDKKKSSFRDKKEKPIPSEKMELIAEAIAMKAIQKTEPFSPKKHKGKVSFVEAMKKKIEIVKNKIETMKKKDWKINWKTVSIFFMGVFSMAMLFAIIFLSIAYA